MATVFNAKDLESSGTTSEVPTGSIAGDGYRCARPETRVHPFSIAIFTFHRFYAAGWEADFGLVMWHAANVAFTRITTVVR